MTIYEFFQDITFEKFKIDERIKEYFNYITHFYWDYLTSIQDILTLQILLNESKNKNDILIYVGDAHAQLIIKFIDYYFNMKNLRIKRNKNRWY